MSYYFSKILTGSFGEIEQKVGESLQKEGFGILTSVDVQATLKKKIDVDFRPYKILGACNPSLAYKALQAEDKIGTMLPCNVVLQEIAPGQIEVAAVDPVASMLAIDNADLKAAAETVRVKLQKVVENL